MTRGGMCAVLALFLCWAPYTRAQEPLFQKPQGPLLQRGTKELALSGTFDVQHEGDAFLDLRGSYGFFPRNYLEVGGFAQIAGDFDETFRYELGGFGEYHVAAWAFLQAPRALPYLGADLSLSFLDSDVTEDNAALIFRPRAGVKWFIRDYFAIDTSFFFALATDDLFPNTQNDLDPYDLGFRLGLRVYFR
jgi:hypothetical protein